MTFKSLDNYDYGCGVLYLTILGKFDWNFAILFDPLNWQLLTSFSKFRSLQVIASEQIHNRDCSKLLTINIKFAYLNF